MKNKISWDVIVFSLIGVLIILLLPSLIQRPSLSTFFDYTKGKDVGSTVGGISGPFISLISAILVYVAFKEQKRATDKIEVNAIIKEFKDQVSQIEEQIFQGKYNIKDINSTLKDNINNTRQSTSERKLRKIYFDSDKSIGKYIEPICQNTETLIYKHKLDKSKLTELFILLRKLENIVYTFEKYSLIKTVSLRNDFLSFSKLYFTYFREDLLEVINTLKTVSKETDTSDTSIMEDTIIELYRILDEKVRENTELVE